MVMHAHYVYYTKRSRIRKPELQTPEERGVTNAARIGGEQARSARMVCIRHLSYMVYDLCTGPIA